MQYAPSSSNSTKNATTSSSALSNKNGMMINVPSNGTLMMLNTAASTNSVANEEHPGLGNTMSQQHLLMNRQSPTAYYNGTSNNGQGHL